VRERWPPGGHQHSAERPGPWRARMRQRRAWREATTRGGRAGEGPGATLPPALLLTLTGDCAPATGSLAHVGRLRAPCRAPLLACSRALLCACELCNGPGSGDGAAGGLVWLVWQWANGRAGDLARVSGWYCVAGAQSRRAASYTVLQCMRSLHEL